MNKFKSALLSLGLACMCSLSFAFLASCDNEDEAKVNISYDTMGAPEITGATIDIGANYTLAVPAEREGYKFAGWYTNSSFEGELVTEIVASANVTYYAKWVQAFAVNLDVNGGSLDVTKVYLEAGENVYEAVKNLIPQKSNLTFGAWFNGNQELSKTYTMKSEALTLTAQYKVTYTVNIYLQNMDGTDYDKSETIVESEYVGKNFTSKQKQTGFTDVSDETTLKKVLSENPAENVFNHYFDRNTYTVTFNVNYPNASNNQTTQKTAKYGTKIELPSNAAEYICEGYCFLGWTSSKTSEEVEYAANFEELLYNNTENSTKKLEYTIEKTTTLYGVWQKGYVDMFGGDDYIYCIQGETDEVYLCRGNVYFKGEFDSDKNEFYFENDLEGKLYNGEKFLYYDTSSSRKKTCQLFISGEGIIESTVIRLDKSNGITYHVYDASNKEIEYSEGTYEVLESGEYVASFTEGVRQGQTLNFVVGTVKNEDGGSQPAFQVRNDDEANLGEIVYTGITKNADGYYSIGYGQVALKLDGFGTAAIIANGQTQTYKYRLDDNGMLTLTDANDKLVETLYIYDIPESKQDQKGYMVYKSALNDEFAFGDNEMLTLDGVYQATYKKGTDEISSYYTSYTTPMGNVIVSIIDVKRVEHKFLFQSHTEIDEETGEEVVSYTVKKVLNTYAEYYYKDAKSIYYAPMLVVNETQAGKATLYGYNSNREYVKISDGSYALGNEGLYVYTVDPDSVVTDTNAYTDPIDLEKIESFVFAMDSEHTNYSVHYWYSSNDNAETYYTDLENTDITSEATLKLVGGFAFYNEKANATAIIGSYTVSETILTFTAENKDYYFYVDLEDGKFTVLQYAPYQAYKLGSDNKVTATIYLDFDGLGGAVYTEKGLNGASDTLISGTIAEVKNNGVAVETLFGDVIYQFTPNDAAYADKAFQYIVIKEGNQTLYATLQTGFPAGTYFSSSASKISGKLTIDGYCNKAEFVTDEETYEGIYYIGEKFIVMIWEDQTFYFDFNGEEFTVRGSEYGAYALFKNKHNDNLFVELDGYGKFTMYSRQLISGTEGEYERVTIIENGTYQINGEVYTLLDGATKFTCVSNGMVYEDKDGNVYYGLSMSQDVATKLFVDTTDWSVLLLDEYGRATKYDEKGRKQVGQYTLITAPEQGDAPNTEYLLYFINNQRTSACIYSYNVETNKATPVKLEPKSYYTEDLHSLYFSDAGFAVFNGNTQDECYYTYEGDNVIIYRRAKDGETANSCGFVRSEFGTLQETKVYEDKLYYRNYGTDLTFAREESKVSEYPIVQTDSKLYLKDLIFAPSGGAEFNVSGVAVFDAVTVKNGETKTEEKKLSCTVSRVIEDGEMKMYLTVSGVYRYDITATYQGDGEDITNVYEVQGLSYVQTLESYRYLDVLFRIYYMYGAASANAYENAFGSLAINITYNVDGTINKSSMQGSIGEAAEIYAENGELISFEESKFEFTQNGGMAEFEVVDEETEEVYTYRLYFGVQMHPYLKVQGYFIISFARVQTLEYTDAENNVYEVVVGRTIATEVEQSIKVGDIYFIGVYQDDTIIQADEFYKSSDSIVYIARERDEENYVTSATYYTITLEENELGSVDENAVATYKSVTVVKEVATVVCEKDDPNETYKGKARFVEIVNGEIKFLGLVGNKRYAKTSTYNAETGIYTVTTTDNRTYYVKYTEDNLNVIITDTIEDFA